MPNAADDPFGAMNAMAQIGTSQRAPEIVIVNDGRPVESVSAGTQAATIGKYVAIALVPFIIGIAIRGVSKDASSYNDGIKGAQYLIKDVKAVKKSLVVVRDKLAADGKKDRAGKEATATLKAIKDLELRTGDVFKYKQNLGAELAREVMDYYSSVATLQMMVNEHLETARSEDLLITAARANSEKAMLPTNDAFQKAVGYKYGVLVWNPSEEEAQSSQSAFGARLVELGPPYCAGSDKVSTSGTCPDPEKPVETLSYRDAPGAVWQRADFAIPGRDLNPGAAIPPKKVLVMSPNGVLTTLVGECAGGADKATEGGCQRNIGGAAAEAAYRKRLTTISKRLEETVEMANKVEQRLSPKSNESDRFSFFM